MDRLNWIVKEIYRDIVKNGATILKWIGYSLLVVAIIKGLLMTGMEEKWIYLITWVAFVLGMTYSWYSMDYDRSRNNKMSSYERASRRYQKKMKGIK